jgi:hypothetical protein
MKDINIYITGASGQVGKALRYSMQEYDIKTFILHRAKLKLFPNETHIQYCLGDYIQPIYDNKINTFYMPNFLWRFIASVLQKIPIGKFNYISERIMGLLDLKDFSELSKNKKVLKFNE